MKLTIILAVTIVVLASALVHGKPVERKKVN
jgi:hypothetical protein